MIERAAEWIKGSGLVVVLLVTSYLGEHDGQDGFIRDIWIGLKTASPPLAMIMFWLYLRADAERRRAQRECADRTVDYIESTNLQAQSSEKSASALSEAVRALTAIARRRRKRGVAA